MLLVHGGTRFRKVANVTRRAVQHPPWLVETVRGKLRNRADRAREFSLADHAGFLCSVPAALNDAFGVTADEYGFVTSRVQIPAAPLGSTWGGGQDILTLLGALTLLRQPRVVVETGVAMGYTTAVVLAAMDANQFGALHSIDLPPLQVDAASFVGQVVPEAHRGRWTLHVGPSRLLLAELAGKLAPLDFFVHDGDHSFAAQSEEYHQAWPHLAPGGCLISDDVCNTAFTEFAAEVGERPYLIAPPGQNAAVGLIVKCVPNAGDRPGSRSV